ATVPATVTIPAGSASASFPIDAVDDFFADGDQELTITAAVTASASGPLTLDASYGIGGLARLDLPSSNVTSNLAMASLADGKVIVASQVGNSSWRITRLNADGTLDTSFGDNGVVDTSLYDGTEFMPSPRKIAIQQNGDFLVGGKFSGGYGRGILVRYKANGSLDPTFGTGGVANLSSLHGISTVAVSDIALRDDGRILLGFTESGTVTGLVAQLNPNGTLDSTFGSGGVARLHSLYRTGFRSSEIEILEDGRFLVAGASGSRAGIVHVRSNGLGLVASFGNNGIALADFNGLYIGSPRMQLDSQGRIVYSASSARLINGYADPEDFVVARFLPDGSPDHSDRKSTRLNSSHVKISYAVFCLK